MGKPKDPKPAKPGVRGEKWALKDGTSVIVLERMPNDFIRCFGETGFSKAVHVSMFKYKEK